MKFPRRFGLSTLLLLMLVVAAVFGYLAWRSNGLRAEVARINREGIGHLELSNNWLFPALKDRASLRLKKDINGGLHIAEKLEPQDVVIAKYEETATRMRRLGAKEVEIIYAEERRHEGKLVDVFTVVHTDSLEGAVTSIAERETP